MLNCDLMTCLKYSSTRILLKIPFTTFLVAWKSCSSFHEGWWECRIPATRLCSRNHTDDHIIKPDFGMFLCVLACDLTVCCASVSIFQFYTRLWCLQAVNLWTFINGNFSYQDLKRKSYFPLQTVCLEGHQAGTSFARRNLPQKGATLHHLSSGFSCVHFEMIWSKIIDA